MSSRVSSRLAAQKVSNQIFDKENSPKQLSSPPATPAPVKEKAATRKKSVKDKQTRTIKDEPELNATPVTPKSTNKPAPAARRVAKTTQSANDPGRREAIPSANIGTKRKRGTPAPDIKEDEDDELPHNMGKRVSAKSNVKQEDAADVLPTSKKSRTTPNTVKQDELVADAKEIIGGAQEPPKKKAKKAHPYGLTPGETPFPDWPHPTKEECQTVHDLLMGTIPPERRKRFIPPDDIPPPSEVVAACGEVPSILDALIRTLLSAATNGQNSSNAFQGLVKRFGLATSGMGKGSVDWNAVHEASHEDVFDAIKCGGLAKNKSANIKKLLAMVYKENQERLSVLLKAKEAGEHDDPDEEEKAEKELELRTLQQGILTLDYYHHLEKNEALSTFTNYPGIGVKTAACVNLFCMQRPCFAVDTHVFRLCQYLGWVPPEDSRGVKQKKVDRNTTFSHCEVRVPDALKYGLHQLFLEHGKNCPRCRAVTGEKSEGWADADCVIEHLVKRLGAKKGGVESLKKAAKGKKAMKGASGDDHASDMDMSEAESASGSSFISKKTVSLSKQATSRRKATTPRQAATPKQAPNKVSAMDRTKAKRATKVKAVTAKKVTAHESSASKGKKNTKEKSEEEAEDDETSGLSDAPEPSPGEEEEED